VQAVFIFQDSARKIAGTVLKFFPSRDLRNTQDMVFVSSC